MTESKLQKQVLARLNILPGCVAWKHSSGRRGHVLLGIQVKGVSDVIGMVNGRFFAIELKLPNGEREPEQDASIEQITFLMDVRLSGGIGFVANSVEMAVGRLVAALP